MPPSSPEPPSLRPEDEAAIAAMEGTLHQPKELTFTDNADRVLILVRDVAEDRCSKVGVVAGAARAVAGGAHRPVGAATVTRATCG